ncbi:Uncharacterized protein cmbei_6004980 [Cryptosporidium meleagridis]
MTYFHMPSFLLTTLQIICMMLGFW